MSVIQLDNGEVHNIYELKDIKEFVDQEVYDFIEENTVELKDDYEDMDDVISEFKNTIDDLELDIYGLEDNMNWVYNKLDDLILDLDEMSLQQMVEHIKECMNILR